MRSPQPFAIYYGWPSAVTFEGGTGIPVAEQFGQFTVVVLGAGLNRLSHPDYPQALTLVRELQDRNVEVYGYIDMGTVTQPRFLSFAEIEDEIDLWQRMGVTGIFWDDAGYEFAGRVSYRDYRDRLTSLVQRTHSAGLRAFLNAWNPDDLFQVTGPDGDLVRIPPLQSTDLILAESWFVSDNQFVNPTTWHHKAEKLAAYRLQQPFRLACVATGSDRSGMEETRQFQAAYWAAVMYNCDLFQFTNPEYSAVARPEGNNLYRHDSPLVASGDQFEGDVIATQFQGVWKFTRRTKRGEIVVASDGDHTGYGFFRRHEANP
ncbi:MAG: hypothetical protein WA040_15345 [Anaerolineae bacterium]